MNPTMEIVRRGSTVYLGSSVLFHLSAPTAEQLRNVDEILTAAKHTETHRLTCVGGALYAVTRR